MNRGTYPGYRAAVCNGCGLCCLAAPCAVSAELALWRNGGCRALIQQDGRYVCGVITNPLALSGYVAKIPESERVSAIGGGVGCDHRAAWSVDEALALLKTRNIADDHFGFPGDTYPRAAILHGADGRLWQVYQQRKDDEPTVTQMTRDGLELHREVPMSRWVDRGGTP